MAKAKSDVSREAQIVSVGALVITLLIVVSSADPFNSPKFWALILFAAWFAGVLIYSAKDLLKSLEKRIFLAIVAAFAGALGLSTFFGDNLFVNLFGAYQRRTGLLTYIALILFMLVAAVHFKMGNLSYLYKRVTLLSVFFVIYGFIQNAHRDPIHWANGYNPILLTLGNPDFASAVMAIFVVLLLGGALSRVINNGWRYLGIGIAILLTILIWLSAARQGLYAGGVGFGVIALTWINQKNRVLAKIFAGFSALVLPVVILGMIGHGPFHFLYKASVTARGYYFRAAIKMFTQHPIFGVGLDRYGAHFREVRPLSQMQRFATTVISNNAHNVPLQLLATGGIFVFITYIFLVGFIAYSGVRSLMRTSGPDQILVATIFGAWIAYEAQSVISIDNIGIAVWGWVLGGFVVGTSQLGTRELEADAPTRQLKQVKTARRSGTQSDQTSLQPIVSSILVLPVLIVSISMYLGERALYDAMRYQYPKEANLQNIYKGYVLKPLNYAPVDPVIELKVAGLMGQWSASEAESKLMRMVQRDKVDPDSRLMLIALYEQTNQWQKAANARIAFIPHDPLNYDNYYAIVNDSLKYGDIGVSKKYAVEVTKLVKSGQIFDDMQKVLKA